MSMYYKSHTFGHGAPEVTITIRGNDFRIPVSEKQETLLAKVSLAVREIEPVSELASKISGHITVAAGAARVLSISAAITEVTEGLAAPLMGTAIRQSALVTFAAGKVLTADLVLFGMAVSKAAQNLRPLASLSASDFEKFEFEGITFSPDFWGAEKRANQNAKFGILGHSQSFEQYAQTLMERQKENEQRILKAHYEELERKKKERRDTATLKAIDRMGDPKSGPKTPKDVRSSNMNDYHHSSADNTA